MSKTRAQKVHWGRPRDREPINKDPIYVDTIGYENPIELKHSHTKWLSVRWLGRRVGDNLYVYRDKVYKLL